MDEAISAPAQSDSAICPTCGKSFSNVYTMNSHQRQVHEGIRSYVCSICSQSFTTSYKLRRHHLGIHSARRDYHCETCGHAFKTRDMLIKHQRTHFQGMGPFICSICCPNEKFKFKSGLDYHVKIRHTDKLPSKVTTNVILYQCSICSSNYKSRKQLQRHEDSHATDGKISCSLCPKVFRNAKDLAQHEKKNHKEITIYTCSYCQKQYKGKQNFEIHVGSHENEMADYEFVGEEDDISVAEDPCDETDLLKHIDEEMVSVVKIETRRFVNDPVPVFSSDETEDIFIKEEEYQPEDQENIDDFIIEDDGCDDDGNIFAYEARSELSGPEETVNTQDLIEEQFPVTEEFTKPIKNQSLVCEQCGISTKNKSHLTRHYQRKHLQEFNYSCDHCSKRFLLLYDLKRHMVVHSKNRDFSCSICEMKFKTEASLKSHLKTVHSNVVPERKFSCKLCDRSYIHQRHLNYHMRQHVNDKKYHCDVDTCEKSFFYSDAVKWHKIRCHDQPAPFNCSYNSCNKKFIHEKSYETHRKEHDLGEGSLAVHCPLCSKLVSEKRNLKRHLRTCRSVKEFSCKFCNLSFKERYQLTK